MEELNLSFSSLTKEDRNKILESYLSCKSETIYKRFCSSTLPVSHLKELLFKTIEKEDVFYYAIKDEQDGIIGDILFFGLNENECELGITIFDKYQHKGYGNKLLSFGIEEMRKKGFHQINADVIRSNKAMLFLLKKKGELKVDVSDCSSLSVHINI